MWSIVHNQTGGQAQNLAIDVLLKTLGKIARDIRKHLNYSKKKLLRPTVLIHDIEEAFNNTHPKLVVQTLNATISYRLGDCFYIRYFDNLSETPKPFKASLLQESPT
jgi:hypothetical protein